MAFERTRYSVELNRLFNDIFDRRISAQQLETRLTDNPLLFTRFKEAMKKKTIVSPLLGDPKGFTILAGSPKALEAIYESEEVFKGLQGNKVAMEEILRMEENFGKLARALIGQETGSELFEANTFAEAMANSNAKFDFLVSRLRPTLFSTAEGFTALERLGSIGGSFETLLIEYAISKGRSPAVLSALASPAAAAASSTIYNDTLYCEYLFEHPGLREAILGGKWGGVSTGEQNYGYALNTYFKSKGQTPNGNLPSLTGSNLGQLATNVLRWMLTYPPAAKMVAESDGLISRTVANTSFLSGFYEETLLNSLFISYFLKNGRESLLAPNFNASYISANVANSAYFNSLLFSEKGRGLFDMVIREASFSTRFLTNSDEFRNRIHSDEYVQHFIDMVNQGALVNTSTRVVTTFIEALLRDTVWNKVPAFWDIEANGTAVLGTTTVRNAVVLPEKFPLLDFLSRHPTSGVAYRTALRVLPGPRLRLLDEDARELLTHYLSFEVDGNSLCSYNDFGTKLVAEGRDSQLQEVMNTRSYVNNLLVTSGFLTNISNVSTGTAFSKLIQHQGSMALALTKPEFRTGLALPANYERILEMFNTEAASSSDIKGWFNTMLMSSEFYARWVDRDIEHVTNAIVADSRYDAQTQSLVGSMEFYTPLLKQNDASKINTYFDPETTAGLARLKYVVRNSSYIRGPLAARFLMPDMEKQFLKIVEDAGSCSAVLGDVNCRFALYKEGPERKRLMEFSVHPITGLTNFNSIVGSSQEAVKHLMGDENFALWKTRVAEPAFGPVIFNASVIGRPVIILPENIKWLNETFKHHPGLISSIYTTSAYYTSTGYFYRPGMEDAITALFNHPANWTSGYITYSTNIWVTHLCNATNKAYFAAVIRKKYARNAIMGVAAALPSFCEEEAKPLWDLSLGEVNAPSLISTAAANVKWSASPWHVARILNKTTLIPKFIVTALTLVGLNNFYAGAENTEVKKIGGLGSDLVGTTPELPAGHGFVPIRMVSSVNGSSITLSWTETSDPSSARKSQLFNAATNGTTYSITEAQAALMFNVTITGVSHPAATYEIGLIDRDQMVAKYPAVAAPTESEA